MTSEFDELQELIMADMRKVYTERQDFSGFKGVVTVYEALRPEVTPLNLKETLQRRPEL